MENVNEKPSYEELAQAYMQLVQENLQMKLALSNMQLDKTDDHVKTLLKVITSEVSAEIKELAEYHLKEVLKKPEDIKTEE